MAHDEHLADFPPCASIPHAIFNYQVVFCPHDDSYTVSYTLGDDTESVWSRRTTRYGPFDTQEDLASDLAQWLRVLFRRPMLRGALAERREASWEASMAAAERAGEVPFVRPEIPEDKQELH
jgi:hypothetical protein